VARAERLLALIQALRRQRRPVSAERLAAELEVSVRSVYRDVQTLRARGASIEGEAGLGYVLRPGFSLPPLMFTDDELEALVLGLRLTAEHADAGLARAALDVMAKLRAVLPREIRTTLEETALLAGPARARPPETIELALVRKTIRESKKARLAYTDAHGTPSERVVWPLALGFFERSRVLVAWCESRNDFRGFRIDRISEFTALAQKLPRPRMALLGEWREREGVGSQLSD
jgi:predicted DNA-binding transcriptional regulator YafY